MKSNQERSNECLPPKKRELPSENRSLTVAPAPDPQRSDNVAWLVAGGNGSTENSPRSSAQSDTAPYKSLASASDSSSMTLVSSLPTVYTSPLSQTTVGGTVHYAQLPPNLQFITSPYSAPYTGYIAPQLLPPPPPPPPLSSSSHRSSSHTETASSAPSHTSKYDQQRASIRHTSTMPPPPTDATPHRASPRTLRSPQSLHGHHIAASQYTDGGTTRKEEGESRQLHNGGLERSRRFESGLAKPIKSRDTYESCQLVLPSDYSHDPLALRTSVMLMPNSHGDHQLVSARGSPEKTSAHLEKGSILLGKPIHRTTASSTPSFTFPPPLNVDNLKAAVGPLSPQTVIHTTHNSTVESLGLPSTGVYPQAPVIGYIAGASGSQHSPLSYHTSLQQHVLITGAQPVIIPVSGSGMTTLESTTSQVVTSSAPSPFPAALPHAYIAATRGETQDNPSVSYHQVTSGGVVRAQLHLPVVPSTVPPPQSSAAAPPSLPPYFVKGSIIQLADGELKRVEELKTEDFIQSAEISSELKIDSSTVERIEGSHASPNLAVVQFSVGEHRAQVSVEVLVEYPFFVFGQGWSSCCPDRTTQLLELPCTKLSVGDVCISLTLKNLRNGSLTRTQPPELAPPTSAPASSRGHPRAPKPVSNVPQRCSGGVSRHGERENGLGQRGRGGSGNGGSSGGGTAAENGDLAFVERGSRLILKDGLGEPGKRGMSSGARKRRWSAPEGRKVEKSEEPPLTLAKPSFIPHEVKVTIEGRSNIGK
uniref:ataxin-1a n=1 Tax=Doryrhamphus excisus TaxID=161450 RepID=UPI0025ADDD65|nr:ataxin-1a [Doryrhamphus excisus]XP_057902848.1 ataxin-1a [Doryrhamphus excisus]